MTRSSAQTEARTRPLVTIKNLDDGLRYLRENKPHWSKDFHYALYVELAEWQATGLDEAWWDKIVPVLSRWRALRPFSKAHIHERGLTALPRLEAAYRALRTNSEGRDFGNIEWNAVSELFDVAHSIKEVSSSPMFGSKLCHFIAPDLYPVIDGEAVGLNPGGYRAYWENCQLAWSECDHRELLIARMREANEGEPFADYPWGPKITELCRIGENFTKGVAY